MQPEKTVACGHAAPAHFADAEIRTPQDPLRAEDFQCCLECRGLADRRGIDDRIVQVRNSTQSREGIPVIEAARDVREDQPHVWVRAAETAEGALVSRV